MTTLMQASRQWMSRPDDERFVTLTDLHEFCDNSRRRSVGKVVSSRQVRAVPLNDDPEHKGLVVVGPSGNSVATTHWSFGQLASRAGAPAGYMRDLPAPLAADCINYGLHVNRDVDELGILLTVPEDRSDAVELRAVTGPNYGRIWNADITGLLVDRFGDGISGDWRVPGEFGKKVNVTKENTTLYASDRDMFVFLADEKNRIEVPNRRDGQPGSLARGAFFWNSEVGKSSWGMGLFLFDFVCKNRMVWGAEDYTEIRGIHTSGAPDRWLDQVVPALKAYANSSARPMQARIEAAQQKKIDDIETFLNNRFSKAQASAIAQVHEIEEGRPIESLWDAATAITAYARELPHQDVRVTFERKAGDVLKLAA